MLLTNNCNNKDGSNEEKFDLSFLSPIVCSPITSVTFDTDSITSENLTELPEPQKITSGSTVHVESSSDVIIGPLTQFHGPVTIYQNINAEKVEKGTETITNGTSQETNKFPDANAAENQSTKAQQTFVDIILKTSTKRLVIYSVIILLTVITTVLGTLLPFLISTKVNMNTDEMTTKPVSSIPHLTSHRIYAKKDWGGRPSLNFTKLLKHPVEYVLISHTAGRFCKTFTECSSIMQQIQSMHISNSSPDIGYNFLIGGDGGVYVGRGWDVVNFHQNNSVGISFIGNYIFDQLTAEMMLALENLLDIGVKLKKLSGDYKIMSHNQTFATLSPGQNVYNKISQMVHFYEGYK